jgi:DNA-binding transcriptional regulator YdaS (Cro superfamily)
MSNGYSSRFAKYVNSADTSKIGVQLGNLCIDNDILVVDVAEHFGVSRATIYNWFKGLTNVPPSHQEAVAMAVKKLLGKA